MDAPLQGVCACSLRFRPDIALSPIGSHALKRTIRTFEFSEDGRSLNANQPELFLDGEICPSFQVTALQSSNLCLARFQRFFFFPPQNQAEGLNG